MNPKISENPFFLSSKGTYSSMETYTKIDHILDHKVNLDKFKIIKIIQDVFPEHSGLNLAINNGKITEVSLNIWKLYKTILNNPWFK